MYGSIQHLRMKLRYNQDHAFALHLRMICVLALVPPNDAINAFDTLCQETRNNFNADADDLLEYSILSLPSKFLEIH